MRTCYSLQELREANRIEYTEISQELHNLFTRIHRNKFLHGYLNPFNQYLCPPNQRRELFTKAEAFSDEKLVEDLRTMLSKVTENNCEQVKEKVRRLPFTESSWELILPMLHQVTIDCVFLIDWLLEIIMVLEELHPGVVNGYQELLLKEFQAPQEFSETELCLEDPMDRAKRWYLSNLEIMTRLYCKGNYTHGWFMDNVLQPIMDNANPDNIMGVEGIQKIWELIEKHMELAYLEEVIEFLDDISQDNSYPSRLRFLLMDLIESFTN